MNFLADNNNCGQALLRLVAKGNSIVADLLRLKDLVPSVYRNPTRIERQKYGELLTLDFTYFERGGADVEEKYERRIQCDDALSSADEELKESYSSLLYRFYHLFNNVHAYVKDLISYIEDVESGSFVEVRNLEAIFLDDDGKQLLCESLYVYGVILLLIDVHVESGVRERLLVAHYRYSGTGGTNLDDICQLLRATGFSSSLTKRPLNYPDKYFSRMRIPEEFAQCVVDHLRSDDVYHQLKHYPMPEHRSTALSYQASMLFVSLFFVPNILHNESATMREVVDKFFPDTWVVSYYMGNTVNLLDAWDPYKAAKNALANTLLSTNVKEVCVKIVARLKTVQPQTERLLREGKRLTEETVLCQSVKMLNGVRECNVLLRWMMLHTSELSTLGELGRKAKSVRDQVAYEIGYGNGEMTFILLLNVALVEFRLRSIYRKVLEQRERKWETCKSEACSRMSQLALIYGKNDADEISLKNRRLQKWFEDRGKDVTALELEDSSSCRMAAQLIEALTEAEELDQLDTSWQVKQLLSETRDLLRQSMRVGGAKEDFLITLQICGDLSYAWGHVVDTFTSHMQKGVKEDPSLVDKLRAVFLKLSSAMEHPVLRISQAKSQDMESVSQYYSAELVAYVSKVLQVIPEELFTLLDNIIKLQTDEIQEIPTKVEKNKLRDFAQLEGRFKVAKLTYLIAVFTEGMLSLKSTLVGVIKVDPKKLLENGIRKEIVKLITITLHSGLCFNTTTTSSSKAKRARDLISILDGVGKVMCGYQKSFEYISDYVGISGLGMKVWHTELSRVFNFIVEQESNTLVKRKILPTQSIYQNHAVPIPLYLAPPTAAAAAAAASDSPFALTFMGRLANELVAVTSPKYTIFLPNRQTWYDSKTLEKVSSLSRLLPALERAIGLYGLVGLDKILGLRASTTYLKHSFIESADKRVFQDKNWILMLDNLADSLSNGSVIASPYKFYHHQHVARVFKTLVSLAEALVNLGHLQLLRKLVAYQMTCSAKFDAKLLHSALQTFNK